MIKYLGSKRTLLPTILAAVRGFPEVRTVVDLFSGTSRVGHALKAEGYRVFANDVNAYAATLARCYVEADAEDVADEARRLIAEFNALPPRPGFFTETYCERARYFHPKNGARVDAVRDAVAAKGLRPELEAVCLVALMEAADRVDSTTGVQMAYLKSWATRASRDMELRLPALLPRSAAGKGRATCLDAREAAVVLRGDLVYLDPPYNRHSYLGNYHVWETLIRWDRPEVYGVACKREDVRSRRSDFNSSPIVVDVWTKMLAAIDAPVVVASCNDEGFLPLSAVEELLRAMHDGAYDVRIVARAHQRYVGAQIGVYNVHGRKVGKPGRKRNTEYLLVAARRGSSVIAAANAAADAAAAMAADATAAGSLANL